MFNHIIPFNISQSVAFPTIICPGDEKDLHAFVLKMKENQLLNTMFDYYVKLLEMDEQAQDYLRSRKIDPTHLGKIFRIGFADNSFGNTLDRSRTVSGEETRAILRRMGVMQPTGYQYFRQSIVFLFPDEDGKILGAMGRRIADRARNDLQIYLHWNQEAVTFFNLAALKKHKRIILCKSPIEALTLWCAGIQNVVAIMGIYSFNEKHLSVLEQYGTKEVAIGFDNTDCANYVSGMVAQAIESSGIRCSRLLLPRHHDINQYALSEEDHVSALKNLVENACPFHQTYTNLLAIQ